MSIILGAIYNKRTKMKFLKIFKKNTQGKTLQAMSEQDIALLAFMCKYCKPLIVKKELFRDVYYGYYVPFKEEYINIAQKIFVKNGINMVVHNSGIDGKDKRNVLRINYNDVSEKTAFREEMEKIKQKNYSIYLSGKKEELEQLEKQVSELKQR